MFRPVHLCCARLNKCGMFSQWNMPTVVPAPIATPLSYAPAYNIPTKGLNDFKKEHKTFPTYLLLSSSVGATTLGGFWPALRLRSTIFYLYTSLSSFSLSSSLNPLLLSPAISILVFLLVLMNMVPIHLIF